MTKIYRTVPIKDEGEVKGRMPEKKGFYGIYCGYGIFTNAFFNGDKFDNQQHMSSWLEEVEVPSDDEIEIGNPYHIYEQKFCFVRGAKWMLNLILNKK